MLADELNKIQDERKKIDEEFVKKLIMIIDRDLKEHASKYDSRSMTYNIIHGEVTLKTETGDLKFGLNMLDPLDKHYQKEGLEMTAVYDKSYCNGRMTFKWGNE